ncbi:hypothetical protein Tco_1229106 [Tanacetum coccineum]
MLKSGEYELWRMRMEQYIQMIDYSLWEVIENGIPNEHQLKFNSIKDAKSLLQAIEKRLEGNVATKKTQRNLLKQRYENFTTSSSDVLDQTFDRLQKLISQLEIHGETFTVVFVWAALTCLAVLTDTKPDFISTALGTMFFLAQG